MPLLGGPQQGKNVLRQQVTGAMQLLGTVSLARGIELHWDGLIKKVLFWIFRMDLLRQSGRVDQERIHPALPYADSSRRSGCVPAEPYPPLEQRVNPAAHSRSLFPPIL